MPHSPRPEYLQKAMEIAEAFDDWSGGILLATKRDLVDRIALALESAVAEREKALRDLRMAVNKAIIGSKDSNRPMENLIHHLRAALRSQAEEKE